MTIQLKQAWVTEYIIIYREIDYFSKILFLIVYQILLRKIMEILLDNVLVTGN